MSERDPLQSASHHHMLTHQDTVSIVQFKMNGSDLCYSTIGHNKIDTSLLPQTCTVHTVFIHCYRGRLRVRSSSGHDGKNNKRLLSHSGVKRQMLMLRDIFQYASVSRLEYEERKRATTSRAPQNGIFGSMLSAKPQILEVPSKIV